MSNEQYITFIGAGNVAWHLAPALDNAGYSVREVYSHNKRNADALVNRLYQAEVVKDLDFSLSESRFFMLAVPDDVIPEVAQEIILPDQAVLLHTSGARPMGDLTYAASDYMGVFYPLQTFSKTKKINLGEVPICIEANDKSLEQDLLSMGRTISNKVIKIDSEHRKSLHVGAVFACNFTNHLLKISQDILNKHHLDFTLLGPLIVETINKSLELGPANAQTGPAKRHDFETLDSHMEVLKRDEDLTEIYRLITQHIIDTYPQE